MREVLISFSGVMEGLRLGKYAASAYLTVMKGLKLI